MTIAQAPAEEQVPLWRSIEPTVGPHNNVYPAGSEMRSRAHPIPHAAWAPANAAAKAIARSQPTRHPHPAPPAVSPFPNFEVIGRSPGGNAILAQRRAAPRAEPVTEPEPVLPRYICTSITSVLVDGKVLARGQKVSTISWPDAELRPQNQPAELVWAYYAQHADDPRLPAVAWNVDLQRVNTIEAA